MDPTRRCRYRPGFTLIELLVVVAIIALLISILLPSLSKAREQARATLCASRISQLTKSILLYADDYSEAPPFLARGWEDIGDTARLNSEQYERRTLMDWALDEDWCIPDPPSYWDGVSFDPNIHRVQDGTLFPYTRFESLYRCPDFERVTDPGRSQNAFNYTRTFLARKWLVLTDPECEVGASEWVTTAQSRNWCGQAGALLKLSQIHSPGQMWMMIDERWDKHVGAPPDNIGWAGGGLLNGAITEVWMGVEPIFAITGNEIGQYHGSPRLASILNEVPQSVREQIAPIKQGSTSFYDGHVGLETDPVPDRTIEGTTSALIVPFLNYIVGPLFAQRGLTPDLLTMFESPL